jgi:uncharacterized protein (TIGR02246 family)
MAGQTTGNDVRGETVRANGKWMDAYRRQDAAGIANRYTEDAQVLPQGSDLVRGRQAVQNLFQGLFDQGIKMIELHTGEVEQHGDRLIEVSTATLRGEGDHPWDAHSTRENPSFLGVRSVTPTETRSGARPGGADAFPRALAGTSIEKCRRGRQGAERATTQVFVTTTASRRQ